MMSIGDLIHIDRINLNNANRELSVKSDGEGESFQKMLKRKVAHMQVSKSEVDSISKKPKDKKMMDLCVQMESILVARMLKEMRKTVHKGELINGGFAEEVFEDMLYDEYAKVMSKTARFGLADMVYQQVAFTENKPV